MKFPILTKFSSKISGQFLRMKISKTICFKLKNNYEVKPYPLRWLSFPTLYFISSSCFVFHYQFLFHVSFPISCFITIPYLVFHQHFLFFVSILSFLILRFIIIPYPLFHYNFLFFIFHHHFRFSVSVPYPFSCFIRNNIILYWLRINLNF